MSAIIFDKWIGIEIYQTSSEVGKAWTGQNRTIGLGFRSRSSLEKFHCLRLVYLHSEMLYGSVLSIHVKCLVLWHRQHLLQVCLDCRAALVVYAVAVANR